MFTGLIECCALVIANETGTVANRLKIQNPFADLCVGESIAVQGVCLTLLADSESYLSFDVSPETLRCTVLGSLKLGDNVNLERAMQASARFGGHYVTGHIDTTVRLKARQNRDDYVEMHIGPFEECDMLYLLPKGSITLDGVSLTINTVEAHHISVLLVPHTLQHTTLAAYQEGHILNVEFDYVARMIAHQVKTMVSTHQNP